MSLHGFRIRATLRCSPPGETGDCHGARPRQKPDADTPDPRRVAPWIESTPIAKLTDELKRRGSCPPDTAEE